MKPAVLLLFLLTFTVKSYSQAINCNDRQALKASLKALHENDQQMRLDLNQKMQTLKMPQDSAILMPVVRKIRKQDTENQKYVSTLLDQCGWPDNLDLTENSTIFLVIDHGDVSYIKKYLPLIYQKMQQGVVQKSDYATISDRLLMYEGKKQVYGTQTYRNQLSGLTTVWPVENAAQLDEQRKAMSLTPMNEYIESLKAAYGKNVTWDKALTVEEAQKTYRKSK
ncbi:DUF6624 domain-containing protein [Mucilaginibacter sp. CSA2-8R]|uniref:DUF6624 domain-containing protein n=1 Tax=Mucilaginibacter sp. CSA2-8R TaxID=3141542 RepID=UPI00315CC0B9